MRQHFAQQAHPILLPLSPPILLGLAFYRWRFRIFDLHPCGKRCSTVMPRRADGSGQTKRSGSGTCSNPLSFYQALTFTQRSPMGSIMTESAGPILSASATAALLASSTILKSPVGAAKQRRSIAWAGTIWQKSWPSCQQDKAATVDQQRQVKCGHLSELLARFDDPQSGAGTLAQRHAC